MAYMQALNPEEAEWKIRGIFRQKLWSGWLNRKELFNLEYPGWMIVGMFRLTGDTAAIGPYKGGLRFHPTVNLNI